MPGESPSSSFDYVVSDGERITGITDEAKKYEKEEPFEADPSTVAQGLEDELSNEVVKEARDIMNKVPKRSEWNMEKIIVGEDGNDGSDGLIALINRVTKGKLYKTNSSKALSNKQISGELGEKEAASLYNGDIVSMQNGVIKIIRKKDGSILGTPAQPWHLDEMKIPNGKNQSSGNLDDREPEAMLQPDYIPDPTIENKPKSYTNNELIKLMEKESWSKEEAEKSKYIEYFEGDEICEAGWYPIEGYKWAGEEGSDNWKVVKEKLPVDDVEPEALNQEELTKLMEKESWSKEEAEKSKYIEYFEGDDIDPPGWYPIEGYKWADNQGNENWKVVPENPTDDEGGIPLNIVDEDDDEGGTPLNISDEE